MIGTFRRNYVDTIHSCVNCKGSTLRESLSEQDCIQPSNGEDRV